MMLKFDIDSLISRLRTLEWKSLFLRIKSLGWRRPLFLALLIPLMFHVLSTVTHPEYGNINLNNYSQTGDVELNEPETLYDEIEEIKKMPGFEKLGLNLDEMYIKSDKQVIMNPLIKYLLEYSPGQLKHAIILSIIRVEAYNGVVLKFYTTAAVLLLLSMAALCRTNHVWAVLPFAKAGLNISGFMIFITVILAPLFWFMFDYNLLGRMCAIFLKGPLYLFISSTVSLKIYDFNNPIYSRLIISLTSLTVSAAIIYVF